MPKNKIGSKKANTQKLPDSIQSVVREQNGVKRRLSPVPGPRKIRKLKQKSVDDKMLMKSMTQKHHKSNISVEEGQGKYNMFTSLSQPQRGKEVLRRSINQLLHNWQPPLKLTQIDTSIRLLQEDHSEIRNKKCFLSNVTNSTKAIDENCKATVNNNEENDKSYCNENNKKYETVVNKHNYTTAPDTITNTIFDQQIKNTDAFQPDSIIEVTSKSTETLPGEDTCIHNEINNCNNDFQLKIDSPKNGDKTYNNQELVGTTQDNVGLAYNSECLTSITAIQSAYYAHSNNSMQASGVISKSNFTESVEGSEKGDDLETKYDMVKDGINTNNLQVLCSPKTPEILILSTPPTPPTIKIQINNGRIIFTPDTSNSYLTSKRPIFNSDDLHSSSHSNIPLRATETEEKDQVFEVGSQLIVPSQHQQNFLMMHSNTSTNNSSQKREEYISFRESNLEKQCVPKNLDENLSENFCNNFQNNFTSNAKPVSMLQPEQNYLEKNSNECVQNIPKETKEYIGQQEPIYETIHTKCNLEVSNEDKNTSSVKHTTFLPCLEPIHNPRTKKHISDTNLDESMIKNTISLKHDAYSEQILNTYMEEKFNENTNHEDNNLEVKGFVAESTLQTQSSRENIQENFNKGIEQDASNLKNKEPPIPTINSNIYNETEIFTYKNTETTIKHTENNLHNSISNYPLLAAEAPSVNNMRPLQGASVSACTSQVPYTPYSFNNSAEIDDEFTFSQLAFLENELGQDFVTGSKNQDKQNTLSNDSGFTVPSYTETFIPKIPQMNWAHQMKENKQKLRSTIQEISRLNAMLTKVRKELWPSKIQTP